ncbi:response regulator, partial [candidate division GN15 bacterium]|nr:response regulator [candidate division GN15 bacterium]
MRVLLVDDEKELVSTLVERLGYRGIKADYALDGYQAMSKLQENEYQA